MQDAVKAYFDRRARSERRCDAPGGDESGVIARLVNERVQGRVLEIGCGTAPSIRGEEKGRWVAMDISLGSLKGVRHAPQRVCGDASFVPFRPGVFDCAVSVHMFHHLVGRSPKACQAKLEKAIDGISWILVPKGTVVAVDTTAASWFYPIERLFFPVIRVLAGLFEAPPVLFRSLGALRVAMARAGLRVHEECQILAPGKALTPWGSSIRLPMWLSPLRDVLVVAWKAEVPEGMPCDP